MFTILAFLLSTAGSINWLMIGLFQYDFIAGIFGLQASILSRLCYILFGFSCFVLVFKLIKGKGAISVFSKRNTKDLEKNMAKMQSNSTLKPPVKKPNRVNTRKSMKMTIKFFQTGAKTNIIAPTSRRKSLIAIIGDKMLRHLSLFAIFFVFLSVMLSILFFNHL